MDENAGEQTAATVKNRDQQEAHRNCKNNLTQVADQIHATAVKEVDDMPDAEGNAGNDDCRFGIILCDGCKQEPSENHFLQESNAEHTHDPAGRFRQRVTDCNAVPEVSGCQNHQRHIVEKPPCRNGRFAKAIPFPQVVFQNKSQENYGLQNTKNSTYRILDSNGFV